MRVALITGASSGIGLATARLFLANGVAVVGIARDAGKLAAMKRTLSGSEAPLETLAVDATEEDAPRRAVDLALQSFGRLDHLVNNAGIGSPKPVHETDDETLDYFLDLMLRAPFRFCRQALTAFGAEATIVNVSSTYSLLGGLRGGAYSAAKGGINALTTHLACQYGSSGVRASTVAPGVIPTPMTQHRLQDEGFRRMNYDMTPAARMGTVEDVAHAIHFLSSPASGWINGQVLAVDGGWSSTKFLTEDALTAERRMVAPGFSHSGKPRPAE
ncbi:SDR family oxidoreductase [Aquamicrobium sp. LC103]|uniref:SDR family NAD(P)-dependent oxidoreductase n=1 Tax=Aquamicrobium sp. LC103 TaxID=1120658 RepID=UPI00063E74B1|nr:SDR family oxidoreductase [Aquamicrobium sp. LC103]TKT78376.1 SDR family oxidoreductase [Aquamicrobium sp. LC103]